MKIRKRRRVLFCAAAVLCIAMAVAFPLTLRRTMTEVLQREAENILYYYNEKIMLQLRGSMNEADALAQTARIMGLSREGTTWFEAAAKPLLDREEVRYVCLIDGDTMASALPKDEFGGQVGRDLKDFTYIYTMAKVVKELVVEGPVVKNSAAGQEEVFLFLQPVVQDNAYLGEVVVALDGRYVLEQLGLEELSARGYDYELWRVEPQNGGKEVIASSGAGVDFSQAEKTTFYLPTQWNLSIQPTHGWLTLSQETGLVLLGVVTGVLLEGLLYLLCRLSKRERTLKWMGETDQQTGLYNQKGFLAALDRWFSDDTAPIVLFYFSFEGYNQASQMMGPTQESAFLRSIPGSLEAYIHSPFLAGRVGAGNFAVAVREEMDDVQQADFARGLSLELLLKVKVNGEKSFLMARYHYALCQPENGGAEEALTALVHAYYARLSGESPARALTEKCQELIEGHSDVVFDEYTDFEMMELSKTFNRYRKQVEQLAYFDPVFNVGNRPKYIRDTNMLISYDKKRKFSLFCVDICGFSQYNELFSADVGDEILREVLHRLSRPFGSYLYRINGDVFLGLSLSDETMESFTEGLHHILTRPVSAGNASFQLTVRIAACQYPAHGDTPVVLLDRIQSALRFAKESERQTVIYDDALDTLLRTEADILHRIKSAIQENTLQVWYQPMARLETGRYEVTEALVRLPDGRGGYFSAGQVIALAERDGMVEQLGDYVLERACSFMHTRGQALGLRRMSINLSVQQLLIDNSADHLLRMIEASGVPPEQITLEITESVLIQSMDHAVVTLEKLRRTGIHIALDDFGVGYSSLNYLSNLPVDIIKIDRSLTQQILTNPKQHALLKSIVEMARINDLVVVAEGVETAEEQKVISEAGVQYIQGYYYAKPMPEEEVIPFIEGQGR